MAGFVKNFPHYESCINQYHSRRLPRLHLEAALRMTALLKHFLDWYPQALKYTQDFMIYTLS